MHSARGVACAPSVAATAMSQRLPLRSRPSRISTFLIMQNRFWSKVNKTAECWLWTGALDHYGYGAFHFDGNARRAHRLAYAWLVGPIPSGLTLDHLCRNR